MKPSSFELEGCHQRPCPAVLIQAKCIVQMPLHNGSHLWLPDLCTCLSSCHTSARGLQAKCQQPLCFLCRCLLQRVPCKIGPQQWKSSRKTRRCTGCTGSITEAAVITASKRQRRRFGGCQVWLCLAPFQCGCPTNMSSLLPVHAESCMVFKYLARTHSC